ncbi:MAG TPA: glycosyltransferase [Pseudolabrys sp.]|nr:glycosyltransferase [Pseudolabrys sp.]
MSDHVLYVGGEDHHSRIPFLLAIQRCGFRVTAAGSGPAEPFRKAGIEFRRFNFDRFVSPLSDLRSIRALADLLRDVRPDLAQAYDAKPCLMLPLAALLAKTGTKTIRTMCGRGWVYSPGSMAAVAIRPAFHILHRIASWSTAATVFEIEDDHSFFDRRGNVGKNGIVIPAGGGGIDAEGFERALDASASREDVRRSLGLSNAEIVITVGRMTRQKGILTLLKAAALVHAERPDVRFLLVGPRESEGPWAVSQAELDSHAPYVITTGPRSDIPALLRAADLFAFPTEYREGIPRALLEAAMTRLPIVATSMPGCCAFIRDCWNGHLVPPRAPEALARAIIKTLENRNTLPAMTARALERAKREFSLTAIVERHAILYARLLSETPNPRTHARLESSVSLSDGAIANACARFRHEMVLRTEIAQELRPHHQSDRASDVSDRPA